MQSRAFVLLAAVLIPAFSLQGCGGGKQGPATDENGKRLFQGDVLEGVETIQKNEWAEPCDKQDYSIRKEMALALHAHAEIIKELEQAPVTQKYEVIKFDSIQFTSPIEPPPAPRVGFQVYESSWRSLYQDYLEFKDNPKSKNWRWLNRRIRGILVDDVDRTDGKNYYITPTSGPGVIRTHQEILACTENPTCKDIRFSTETREFLKTQPLYVDYEVWANRATDLKIKRERIEKFQRYVAADRRRIEFVPHPSVRRISKTTFELPINPGDIKDTKALDFVKKEVENKWKSADRQVRLVWEQIPGQVEKLMRLIFETAFGERAYVFRKNLTIHLFPGTDREAIPHEFGHVLGFRDEYFTVWNEKTCVYMDYATEEDLMGVHTIGKVLPKHWDELEKAYPYISRN